MSSNPKPAKAQSPASASTASGFSELSLKAAQAQRRSAQALEEGIAGIAGIAATAGAPDNSLASVPSRSVAVNFLEADLASTRRHGAKERASWQPGDSFALVPQPDNAVDPDAIAVFQHGKQVGFLSKESAQEIKVEQLAQGWTMAGTAFLASRKGGKWHEGRLHVRMENPIIGWSGYNPSKDFSSNLAAMEREVLGAASDKPSKPAKRSPSL